MAVATTATIATKSRPVRSGRGATYRIPALWHCADLDGVIRQVGQEVVIDPPAYLQACLKWIRRESVITGRVSGKSLSQLLGVKSARARLTVRAGKTTRRAGEWIRQQVMYGMMIRTSTAWDHDGDGRLSSRRVNELGSFLKTVLLLPHLQRMGVTLLYLLPVAKVSHLFRKGELGCPYSAKDFLKLDAGQEDSVFDYRPGDVDGQFRLLVDSAHRLGMRVMLDIAPRTAARDCDWILDHPEWFYWIDRRFARDYAAPHIPGAKYHNPSPNRLGEMYGVPAVREHLAMFRLPPSVTQPGRWAKFARAAKQRPPVDLLKDIGRTFGVITPPGFSDVVNDTQPPWTDVTYLRLFADHPVAAARHLPEPTAQPPYVLYDTAKASLFEGRRPQKELWQRLAGIIPRYQKFGIDGARVDMAHALPKRLEESILTEPRKIDPDFCFLAEELNTGHHTKAHASGYNIIIGSSWWQQPRGHEGQMHKLLAELPRLKIPVMAAAETPDTPRAATRVGKRVFAEQAVVVNCFLPNAVPMVNSGMEVFERQPMNLGLDCKPRDRLALPKRDRFYGKLAFFDRFALHWSTPGGTAMTELIGAATELRHAYRDVLTDPRAYFVPQLTSGKRHVLATGFKLPRGKGVLLMLANLDPKSGHKVVVGGLPKSEGFIELMVSDERTVLGMRGGKLSGTLAASAVIVMRL